VVSVGNAGAVQVGGLSSIGVFAQSVGGGGGSGGFAGGLSAGNSATSQVVGGAGGGAGSGGVVNVTNSGIVLAKAANSIGVFAQSVGGGGGIGGMSLSGAGASSTGVATSIGGSGGGGGDAGAVTVSNSGTIIASGDLSYGVYAQSVGGGGGVAGISVAGTLDNGGAGLTSSIGGTGGAGGIGGVVNVTNSGDIMVQGAASVGILAQSIGGGGGSGGFSGALRVSGGGSINNDLGGAGGAGGAGGDVNVTSTGTIVTVKDSSVAVLAQSIGGGGGQSAFTIGAQIGSLQTAQLHLGGSGTAADGANGHVVVNISGGTLKTAGALSYGLLAQGVGGGGGNAGLSVPDPLTVGSGGVTLMLGGNGGATGNGSNTVITNGDAIVTSGAGAAGLVAQSIGGGGGMEGVTGDVDFGANNAIWSAVAGGSSNSGGTGGTISLSNSKTITTTGDNAFGILAQSIGGGGGDASYSVGIASDTAHGIALTSGGSQNGSYNGDAITFTSSSGAIGTSGMLATGLVAQSIGGGGGVTNFTSMNGATIGSAGISLTAGGTGGGGGNGGAITLNQTGMIGVTGAGAGAVLLQSIGGGGGSVGIDNLAQTASVTTARLGGSSIGNGGKIDFTLSANVSTTGNAGFGVTVQSIGGGGGFINSLGTLAGTSAVLGSSSTGGGNGGAISVKSNATIYTSGIGSHGLVVQSIGDGGGVLLSTDATGNVQNYNVRQASGGNGGTGGAVDVAVNAAIRTTGANADGVIVQSIGGGGGIVGAGNYQHVYTPASVSQVAGSQQALGSQSSLGYQVAEVSPPPFIGSLGGAGAGGTVNLAVNANVVASGANSSAVVVQSAGGTGAAAINLTIASGVQLVGGSGTGHAVAILGGTNNTITNAGSLSTADGLTGVVIYADTGNNSITNSGTIVGSIDLGSGVNSLTNVNGGVFLAGPLVNLGAGTFTNAGSIAPGGGNVLQTLAIQGNLQTTSASSYFVDLDLATNRSDALTVSGTASLSGTVYANVLNTGQARPGTYDLSIVSAAGGITSHSGRTLVAPNSAVANYSLTYPNSANEVLHYVIDFAPAGLTPTQSAVGALVNRIQTAQTSPQFAATAATLMSIGTVSQLGAVYTSTSGEGIVAAQTTGFSAVNAVQDAIDAPAAARIGNTTIAGRMWLQIAGATEQVEAQQSTARITDSSYGVIGGFDIISDENGVFGLAGGYQSAHFDVDAVTTAGQDKLSTASVYAALRQGMWSERIVFSYGKHDYRYGRSIGLPGTAESALGRFDADSVSVRGEISRAIPLGRRGMFRPFGSFSASTLWLDGFKETSTTSTGAPGSLGLQVDAKKVTEVKSYLGAEAYGMIDLGNNVVLRPSLQMSWMHDYNPERSITAGFATAPGFTFDSAGAPFASNAMRVDAAVSLGGQRFEWFMRGNAVIAGRYTGAEGQLGVRVKW
jgi:uncharacterized protein with beta-barrel porin domain